MPKELKTPKVGETAKSNSSGVVVRRNRAQKARLDEINAQINRQRNAQTTDSNN